MRLRSGALDDSMSFMHTYYGIGPMVVIILVATYMHGVCSEAFLYLH